MHSQSCQALLQVFERQNSLDIVIEDLRNGKLQCDIHSFLKYLSESVPLTDIRTGPQIVSLPLEVQSRLLIFISWLLMEWNYEGVEEIIVALAKRLTTIRDISLQPPLCTAIVDTILNRTRTYGALKESSDIIEESEQQDAHCNCAFGAGTPAGKIRESRHNQYKLHKCFQIFINNAYQLLT
jgi:hypothetical protein